MNKNAKKRENLTYNKLDRIKNKAIKEYYVKNNGELLEFLFENIKGQSKNNIKTILKNNCIGVNGAPVKQFNYPLLKGDVVCVSKYPLEEKIKKDNFKLEIIYEDDDFLVINKPYGLLSISSDKEKSKTAYRYCMDYVRSKDKMARIYVVHRIDKETSGVLIFTKNEKLKNILQDKWNDIVSKRGYFAICEGIFEKKEDRLVNYLKMNKENLMYVTKDKKDSQLCITNYKVIRENKNYSLDVALNYLDAVLNTNTNRGKKYFESVDLASLILKEYAQTISCDASTNKIVESLARRDSSITLYKYNNYIEKFKNLYIIKDLPSWNPNLRSKVITRTSETKHFVDPSIATAVLGISPNNLLNDLDTFGLLFEDLVARDLRVYSEYSLNATLRHYRDKSNLEVDIVINRRNDEWAAIEVKLGGEEAIQKGISNLRKLRDKIDYEHEKQPSFLAVITAFGSSYKTEDGIYVFPITQLKD